MSFSNRLAVYAAVTGLVVKANIPGNESVLDEVTKNTLAGLRAVCDSAGADPAGSVLVLNPATFAETLALFDASIYGGTEAIRNGVVEGLYGFRAVMQLPLSTAASEKLVGAIIPAEALVVAGRTIPADDMGAGAECGFTTDERSGLTVGNHEKEHLRHAEYHASEVDKTLHKLADGSCTTHKCAVAKNNFLHKYARDIFSVRDHDDAELDYEDYPLECLDEMRNFSCFKNAGSRSGIRNCAACNGASL